MAFQHGELLAQGHVFEAQPVTGENQPSQISGQEPHKQKHALILTDRNRLIQHNSLILMTDRQKFLHCKCVLGVDGGLNGKRYRRSLFTRNLEKAQRKLAQLQNPDFREPKPLKDAIIEFLKANSDLAHGTLRNQRRILVFLYKIATATKLITLEEFDVESIDLYRSKRPISALAWMKELAILRQFFEFCLRRKWIGSNPAREVKPPKLKPKPKEPYTQDEVAASLKPVIS